MGWLVGSTLASMVASFIVVKIFQSFRFFQQHLLILQRSLLVL